MRNPIMITARVILLFLAFVFCLYSLSFAGEGQVYQGKDSAEKEDAKTSGQVRIDYNGTAFTYYINELESIALKQMPSYADQKYAMLGAEYIRKGQLDKAKESLEDALRVNHTHFGALYSLGALYLIKKEPDKTIEYSMKAVKIYGNAPELSYVYYNLSTAYLMQGEYDKAIDSAQEALQLNSGTAPIYFNLGIAYLKKGDRPSALGQYEKLKDLDALLGGRLLEIINK